MHLAHWKRRWSGCTRKRTARRKASAPALVRPPRPPQGRVSALGVVVAQAPQRKHSRKTSSAATPAAMRCPWGPLRSSVGTLVAQSQPFGAFIHACSWNVVFVLWVQHVAENFPVAGDQVRRSDRAGDLGACGVHAVGTEGKGVREGCLANDVCAIVDQSGSLRRAPQARETRSRIDELYYQL